MAILHAEIANVHRIEAYSPDLLAYRTYTQFHTGTTSYEPTAEDRMWKLSYDLHYESPYAEWPSVPECLTGSLREAWVSGRESAEDQMDADMSAAWDSDHGYEAELDPYHFAGEIRD